MGTRLPTSGLNKVNIQKMVAHLLDKSSHFSLRICKGFYCVGNTFPGIISFLPYNNQDKHFLPHFTDGITDPQKGERSCATQDFMHMQNQN